MLRRQGYLPLIGFIFFLMALPLASPHAGGKQIAITFDELPASRSFGQVDAKAINYLILQALREHQVKATGFVVAAYIESHADLLGQWLNEGHKLGSLTYSNQDINELTGEKFVQEIIAGSDALEEMLEGFGQKGRFFRYPFLHYGIDMRVRKKVQGYLAQEGIIVGHASVVPDDYLYNLSLEKMGRFPDSAKLDLLLNEYVNHVLDELVRVDALGKEIADQPVRQILRLRANRLNAIFLGEMLGALKAEGYSFITLESALRDPVYREPEAYTGTRGVGYLDMIDQSETALLPATEE